MLDPFRILKTKPGFGWNRKSSFVLFCFGTEHADKLKVRIVTSASSGDKSACFQPCAMWVEIVWSESTNRPETRYRTGIKKLSLPKRPSSKFRIRLNSHSIKCADEIYSVHDRRSTIFQPSTSYLQQVETKVDSRCSLAWNLSDFHDIYDDLSENQLGGHMTYSKPELKVEKISSLVGSSNDDALSDSQTGVAVNTATLS